MRREKHGGFRGLARLWGSRDDLPEGVHRAGIVTQEIGGLAQAEGSPGLHGSVSEARGECHRTPGAYHRLVIAPDPAEGYGQCFVTHPSRR